MAFFGIGKKKDTKPESPEEKAIASSNQIVAQGNARTDLTHILKNPRITEKATMHSELGVYLFDISESATKRDVFAAMRKFYSVSPKMVRIVIVPSKIKRNMRTGKVGVKRGGKKAYVYLKKGETINLV